MTSEEQRLLERLSNGELDGLVGDTLITSGGSSVWKTIKDGTPVNYKQGPGSKFFNGEENERIPGVLHVLEEWKTDERKLEFLQKYGWLMNDSEVGQYSAKFKP